MAKQDAIYDEVDGLVPDNVTLSLPRASLEAALAGGRGAALASGATTEPSSENEREVSEVPGSAERKSTGRPVGSRMTTPRKSEVVEQRDSARKERDAAAAEIVQAGVNTRFLTR